MNTIWCIIKFHPKINLTCYVKFILRWCEFTDHQILFLFRKFCEYYMVYFTMILIEWIWYYLSYGIYEIEWCSDFLNHIHWKTPIWCESTWRGFPVTLIFFLIDRERIEKVDRFYRKLRYSQMHSNSGSTMKIPWFCLFPVILLFHHNFYPLL